jgi:glycosyltransferase involved in cell wall biosynthesis
LRLNICLLFEAKKVIFVTSAQPSANPRMLKSAIYLSSLGFLVDVIYARISPWANHLDSQIFDNYKNINWIGVGPKIESSILKKVYLLRQRFWRILFVLSRSNIYTGAKGFTLLSQELELEVLQRPGDLYIGHNLGALRAVIKAANKFRTPSLFDFEDYHRGEHHISSIEYEMIRLLESRYVPFLSFATTSSPLITEKYLSLFPKITFQTILNVFSKEQLGKKQHVFDALPIKLFWFSQHVGLERGLQQILISMSKVDKFKITLTIVGNCSSARMTYLKKLIDHLGLSEEAVQFLGVLNLDGLFELASQHNIGIASEIISNDNREICLTNKIFSYMLAGLAILASSTKAQSSLFKQNKDIGFLFDPDKPEMIDDILKRYLQDPALLRSHQNNSLIAGNNKYNWEIESKNYLSIVQKLIND